MPSKALSAILLLAVSSSPLAFADQTFIVSSTTNWGQWEAWGTSLAWWAKAFGTRTDLSKIFFSTSSTTFNGKSVPGLGLNMARYNAGACSNNTFDGATMVESPNIQASRQMDGYWLDWASTDPASSSWNWNVDASQRAALLNAKANGANHFELFSNSPMWWMCLNHNPSGASNGGENIQSWNLENHALYLATIAKHATQNWGITFNSVEAFNEPSANWWTATGTQEGCHFNEATMSSVIGFLRTALNNQGLSSTRISANDENSYDGAVSTWNQLTAAAKSTINQINVHGYQQGSGNRAGLFNDAQSAGKVLWNSEYGESDATGESLVSNLMLDLRSLHPTAWTYWQVLDGGGWGLIDANNDAKTIGAVSQKYYALAQFTRHIREGFTMLDAGGSNAVAAFDSTNSKLIIVAVNPSSTGQTLTFDLSGFSGVTNGANVARWFTQLGSGSQYVSSPSDTTISGTRFSSVFAGNMIQTFEVPNIRL